MPGDAVGVHKREEVPLGVAAERRLREMRVLGQEAAGLGPGVGEVAPPAARDEDLLSGLVGVVDHQHARPRLPGRRRRQQPRPAGAKDDRVVVHARVLPTGAGVGKLTLVPTVC